MGSRVPTFARGMDHFRDVVDAALAIRPFPEKEGKTDEDDGEMGES